MYEKRLKAVPPQLLTSDGTNTGRLTVGRPCKFRAKQRVLLTATSRPNLELEVKRVEEDGATIWLGPVNTPIHIRSDISAYTTLLLSAISAPEQNRPIIPEEQIERLTYEEEPVVARRSFLVDCLGRPYTTENPFPVQLGDGTINIGTVNAELEVQLSHKDNDPDAGDVHDSVRIGDGTEELAINPDGSINVNVLSSAVPNQPFIQNIPAALSNTEYSVVLPTDTKRFIIKCRSGLAKMQLAYTLGESNSKFMTVHTGNVYIESEIKLTAPLTVYFQLSRPSQIVEVTSWI